MKINLPPIAEQQRFILEAATQESIKQLQINLKADIKPGVKIEDTKHLLREDQGWEAPNPETVRMYFDNLKESFPSYDSDKKIAHLLGLKNDRRIREFKSGEYKVPYGIWRKFLVITGRVPQDILPLLAIFQDE
jgi:hypothetical protein